MPRVVISGQAARRFTGGVTELEVEANTFRRMVLELDRRFPGLGRQIDESVAAAIDGEIFQDAYLAQLKPGSEIYLIPKIGGGWASAKKFTSASACGSRDGSPHLPRIMRYCQLVKVNKMRLKQHSELVAKFPCQSAAEPRFGVKYSPAERFGHIKSRY